MPLALIRRPVPLRPRSASKSVSSSAASSPFLTSPSRSTRAMPEKFSPASRSMSFTPWVTRCSTGTSPTRMRMILPESLISMRSSSPETWRMPETSPMRGVVLRLRMPLPPRLWRRYSAISVRFPNPRSETVMMELPSVGISIPTTWSSSSMRMPMTPVAVRPMERTSSSLKRMAMPLRVPRKISWAPLVCLTSMSSSPASTLMAMMPPVRGLE